MAATTISYVAGNFDTDDAWVEAGSAKANYVKFTVDLSAGQALNIGVSGTENGSIDRGFLNSIQIVAVPEPASLALIGMGGLMIMPVRRRQR